MSEPALIGTTTLMRRAFAGENLEATARVLLERIRINPGDANAAMDLSILFELGGDSLLAMEFQASALSQQSLFREKESLSPTLKVLAIKSRGVIMDNMPLGFLLENSTVQLESLYVGLGIQAPGEIPDHDVAIVAICESDMNQDLLADLASVVAQWPRPVVNDPVHIANLSRDRLGKVVENIDGLVFASSTRWQRHELESLDAGPQRSKLGTSVAGWIIRPTNSHAGHGLEHIAMEQSFSPYLERTSGDDFLIAPFVPYASADGIYRKYRIALIRGESFPVHIALS